MQELVGKSIDTVSELAQKFIPSDISEKIGNRMEDGEKTYVFSSDAAKIINELSRVKGMTPASSRDLKDSVPIFKLKDGTVVSRYQNPARFEHVFISDKDGKFIFGGYVGWVHNAGLLNKLQELSEKYGYYGE
jgi:hypothetical protein